MYKLIIIFCSIVILGGCINITEAPKKANNNSKQSTNNQLLPPEYLSIDGFKSCLKTESKGSAQFYCMPNSKPESCSDEAWEKLNNLKGSEKIPSCKNI